MAYELPKSRYGHRYGYIYAKPGPLVPGVSAAPIKPTAAPRSSNSAYLGPVKDQGDEGSCTAHAGTGNLEYLARRFPDLFPTKYSDPPVFSAQDLYYLERSLDGTLNQGDCGSTGQSSCLAMQHYGVCLESAFPYVAGQINVPPDAAQVANAAGNKAGAYHSIGVVADVRSCLGSQYPVLWGFNVYESFEEKIGSDGLMPTPDYSSEALLGQHETLIYDYDDELVGGDGSTGVVLIRNSWGGSWGKAGDFVVSYKQLADSNITLDFKMQHLGKAWTPTA